jgi:hypothetical protein
MRSRGHRGYRSCKRVSPGLNFEGPLTLSHSLSLSLSLTLTHSLHTLNFDRPVLRLPARTQQKFCFPCDSQTHVPWKTHVPSRTLQGLCFPCALKIFESGDTCPLCRKPIFAVGKADNAEGTAFA